MTGTPYDPGASQRWFEGQQRKGQATPVGPAFTPVRIVLDAASSPAYALGNILSGDPLEAGKNIVGVGQWGRKRFVSDAPIARAGLRRIPGPSWLRTGAALTVDLATDPLTYVTFGAGGAARTAAGTAAKRAQVLAAKRAEEATRRALAAGRARPGARESAEIAIESALARRAAPTTLKVNVRTPLTRNKTRLVAESRLAARAVEAATRPIGGSSFGVAMKRVFRADQGVDPALYEGRRAVRYWAEATQREIRQAIKEQAKAAKKLGVDPERITLHLDQPAKYVPVSAAERDVFASAAALRDDIERVARDAGIDMGFVDNYVMHVPKNPKAAKAFVKQFGRKVENQGYTKHRVLENLDQWRELGIEPELDVWKLLDARAGMGVRDAAVKGYMDALATRGLKPEPMFVPNVAGQRVRVDALQAELDEALTRAPTKKARAEVRAAKQRVRAAQAAVKVARESKDMAAIARAERGLVAAAAAASPDVIGRRVAPRVAAALDEARVIARDRGATRASLPTPTGGRYVATLDDRKAASRVRREVTASRRRAQEARAGVATDLAALVQRFREQRLLDRKSMPTPGAYEIKGVKAATDENRYVRRQRDEANFVEESKVVRSKKGGRRLAREFRPKSMGEYETDLLEELRRGADEGLLDADEARILAAIDRSDEFLRLAGEGEMALKAARGDDLAHDAAEGAAILRDFAERLPRRAVDMRGRRSRAAKRQGDQVTPRVARNADAAGPVKGTPREARARFRRYFVAEGSMTDAIREIRGTVEAEVKAAQGVARREVERAERRLQTARKGADREAVLFAGRMLRDAQKTERGLAAELARAQVTWGRTPRETAGIVRRLVTEQRSLVRMEARARKARDANARLAARPGRDADYQEYRDALDAGWEKHTSKYHKETILDPVTAEAVRMVDAEVARLIVKDTAMEGFTRWSNQLGSAWKALQLATPRYHIRNVIDDGFAQWLAGARNPQSYVLSARIMRGWDGTVNLGKGRKATARELVAEAEAVGAIHMGFAAWEVGTQMRASVTRRFGGVSVPGSGRVSRGSQRVGEVREDWQRLGFYIEMRRKGLSPFESGQTVRRYSYDYSDLSPFLMHARAVLLPFITFTWKTIPMLAKEIASRPGSFSKINIVTEWLNEVGGNPDRSLLAPWEADSFAIPFPDAVKPFFGAPDDEPVIFNPRMTLRYGDLEMWNPRPESVVRNWGGMVGPVARPFEALTGFSLFQARQFRPGERVRAPSYIAGLDKIGVPIPGWGPKRDLYTGEEVPGYAARAHQLVTMFPPFQHAAGTTPGGGVTNWQGGLSRFLTGLNVKPSDEQRARFYADLNAR